MTAAPDSVLDWDGCFNVRDLGGLAAAGGAARTRRGAAVRADSLQALTAPGWETLIDHGVRTVIDLRNVDERGDDAAPRPASLVTLELPLDGVEETELWEEWATGPQFGTPLYYRPHLERLPERSASVLAAIAGAPPGGVAFHCVGGRDRTGQIAMLLLALLGVPAQEIAADYERSAGCQRRMYAARGQSDDNPSLAAFLHERGTSCRQLIHETLAAVDIEATMRADGLTDGELSALRARMLDGQ